MAFTDVEVCNLALAEIGHAKQIESLSEKTKGAEQCERVYQSCVEFVLAEANWPFAVKVTTLGLVQTNPNDFWAYEYRYPSDCVKLIEIGNGRSMTKWSAFGYDYNKYSLPVVQTPFEMSEDASGLLIWTDEAEAVLRYVSNVQVLTRWPNSMIEALVYKVASKIAYPMTGDPNTQRAMNQMYNVMIEEAKAHALKEVQLPPHPDPPSIQVRN